MLINYVSIICKYNLTSDVTVTSVQMGLTPNLDTTSARYILRKMCAKFRSFISSRCDDIVTEVKGGGQLYAPLAAGGRRGGQAAAGLNNYEPIL